MSRLKEYCAEKLKEAKAAKVRACNYLKAIEISIEKGEPVGPMQIIYTEKDIEKAKKFIEHWDSEVKIWEAEEKLLKHD